MKVLVIRQSKSIYNQQNIKNFLDKFVDRSAYSIKCKGKRDFSIFFQEHVSPSIANQMSKKIGFDIAYQSENRYILTDKIDY